MKGRRSVILIGLVLIVLIITYLQWGREVKVCDSSIEKSENYYSENLTIITNKIWVIDKEELQMIWYRKVLIIHLRMLDFRMT